MVTHSEKAIPDLMSVLHVKVQMLLGGSALSTWRSWESHWAAGQSHQPHSPLVTVGSYGLCPIMQGLLQGGPCSPALSVLQEESWGEDLQFSKNATLVCSPQGHRSVLERSSILLKCG